LAIIRQLLTTKMMLSTSADIALEGAHLAQKLATELEWKYKIHTHSQSFKSRQEKVNKAEAEMIRDAAGESQEPRSSDRDQGGVVEAASGDTPAGPEELLPDLMPQFNAREGSDEPGAQLAPVAEQDTDDTSETPFIA
jgi:hypothetical protein